MPGLRFQFRHFWSVRKTQHGNVSPALSLSPGKTASSQREGGVVLVVSAVGGAIRDKDTTRTKDPAARLAKFTGLIVADNEVADLAGGLDSASVRLAESATPEMTESSKPMPTMPKRIPPIFVSRRTNHRETDSQTVRHSLPYLFFRLS